MEVLTVKVNNVSLSATDHHLRDFFSFFAEIQYLELHRNETSQVAYVTFKDKTGAETSILLSGATISDQPVTIETAADYKLPVSVTSKFPSDKVDVNSGDATPVVRKAEAVVSSMLAQGYILRKDAISKAKAFDEKHQILSTATATVATLDQKTGFSEKLSAGTTKVNDKLKHIDEKFQVTEKTKSAYSAAGEKVSTAGSALKSNRFILTGAAWALGAYRRAAQTANEVSQKTKEKIYSEKDKNDNSTRDNQAEDNKADGREEKEGIKVQGNQAEGNNTAAGAQAQDLKAMDGIQVESKKKEGSS